VLGTVESRRVHESSVGLIVRECWFGLARRFPRVILDTFLLMPNHVHGLMSLVGAGLAPPGVHTGADHTTEHDRTAGLPEIVGAFKSISTRRINEVFRTPGSVFWQRGYYEHIVRDGEDLANIRRYILENPARWSRKPVAVERKGSG
jgi:putative transposase